LATGVIEPKLRERDSNSAETPARSVSYCNLTRSGPRLSPKFPGFATRFATASYYVACYMAHPYAEPLPCGATV
jgi:hypothetical protein